MFTLIKCTDKLLHDAETEWKVQAADLKDLAPFISKDIENKFTGLKNRDRDSPDFHVYCLVDRKSNSVNAMLELMHALPSSSNGWLKLLDITLAPSLNLESGEKTEEILKKVFAVLGEAIAKSISLIFKDFNEAGSIKIYGRTEVMRNMFTSLISAGKLDKPLSKIGVKARRESAWLVFEKDQ